MRPQSETLSSEADFFDRIAEQHASDLQMEDVVLQRYAQSPRRVYPKEFRFDFLGDVRGKRVLDLGCGEGCNSVLLAKRGALVTGVDVSRKSVELALARCEANQVQRQCTFICSPIETANIPHSSFDAIWIDDVLHHVIPELSSVLARLVEWCRPGARVVLSEPISYSPFLRRIRRNIPIQSDATPDERPLERVEIDIIRRHFPSLTVRYFHLLTRLNRIILPGLNNYERASFVQRKMSDCLHYIDYALLSLPGLPHFAGSVVMYGRVRGETNAFKA
jgi:2-polyprenyl-3-methyl-5-hydroxy-6-metoxy-1,4-benzoquinol methylase